jgi:hypothetical protein
MAIEITTAAPTIAIGNNVLFTGGLVLKFFGLPLLLDTKPTGRRPIEAKV